MPLIVVMEDDLVVRDLVVRILEVTGYSVQAFEDAAPALESVAWDEVDLVLSDLMMPTPGDLAVRTLRSRGITVPVILMSGQLDPDRLAGLDVQATLAKPFRVNELLQTVQSVL